MCARGGPGLMPGVVLSEAGGFPHRCVGSKRVEEKRSQTAAQRGRQQTPWPPPLPRPSPPPPTGRASQTTGGDAQRRSACTPVHEKT